MTKTQPEIKDIKVDGNTVRFINVRKGTNIVIESKILKDALEFDKIVEEVENDPETKRRMEKRQRKYGTLTSEELRRQFTI